NADGTASGRGIANYLTGITLSPQSDIAWITANKPNDLRGTLTGPELDSDNSVRNLVFALDLASGALLQAVDIDNSDSASAVSYSPLGDYLFVTLQGNNEVAVFDALAFDPAAQAVTLTTRLAAGDAPQGVCVDAQTRDVWVKNFLGRSLTRLAADGLFTDGDIVLPASEVGTVASEALAPSVLQGKRVFYHASDPRMSAEGYISCASCHLDGGHDGRTWDFTGRGEGLRNTTSLRGRGGTAHGNVHWSANFDEIQDFENDIRSAFGGAGFLSDGQFASTSDPLGAPKVGLNADLDALASYVTSLSDRAVPRSPFRDASGALTAQAQAGAAVFDAQGCGTCHSGDGLTDSTGPAPTLHDVGTLRTTSGDRLGAELTGIDTPGLRGVFDTAPYFHDGSAPTLADVFRVAGGEVLAAESGGLSGGAQLVDQWIEQNNDNTVRGAAYVLIGGNGQELVFNGVDGGSGGVGAVELRASTYNVQPIRIRVNGVTYQQVPADMFNDPRWRLTNWVPVRFENVVFSPGASNQVVVGSPNPNPYIGVDEVVISRPDELARASVHRVVDTLPAAQRDALLAYLRQLEGETVAVDTDGDGVDDSVDNCIAAANPGQTDADGDGFGNACDADLNGDCVVNVTDLGLLRQAFFSTPGSPAWNPAADLAGTGGAPDGVVNVIDLGRMRTLFFVPPGPSALATDCP
ncbi:MAG: thrombospondin type 3 repeat-containing protein, partial [Pseudomonadota bacterium]